MDGAVEPEAGSPRPVAPRLLSARLVFILGVALLGLWIVSGLLAALIWAAIIAIAIDPLYLKAMRGRFGRHHGAVLAFLATLAIAVVLVAPIALGVTQLAGETSRILAWIAEAQRNGVPVPDWVRHLPLVDDSVANWWRANLATPEGASVQLERLERSAWLSQSGFIGRNIVHRSAIFAFTLISLFFFLRDRDSLVAQIRNAGVRLLGPSGERIAGQAVLSVRGTIDGLVLVGLGEGAVMAAVYLWLGVPGALLLGLLTAVAAMIPFGAALMFVVAAALLLAQGQGLAAVAVIAIGLVVVGIADHFVRPALIGGATRLPFLWVLIGIVGGVETFGLLGLFVGPSTMAVLYMLWCEFIEGGAAIPGAEADAGTA